jgi:hypothetical protein
MLAPIAVCGSDRIDVATYSTWDMEKPKLGTHHLLIHPYYLSSIDSDGGVRQDYLRNDMVCHPKSAMIYVTFAQNSTQFHTIEACSKRTID